MAEAPELAKRVDGKYEEPLGDKWLAEYFEQPDTGLWRADVLLHDVAKWVSEGYPSLEEARQAARDYVAQI